MESRDEIRTVRQRRRRNAAAPTSTARRASATTSTTIVEAEALGYHSDVHGRASFHRLRPGVGDAQPADLARGAHPTLRLGTAVMVLPWHNPVLLAEQAATHRSAVRRPARIRRRQGLSPQRIRRLLHPDRGGRRALRGSARRHPQGVDLRTSASRITASTGISTTSWSSRRPLQKPHPPIWMARGQPELDPPGGARAATSCCSTSSPRSDAIDRALQHLQGRGRGAGRRFDPQDVGVARAFYVAKDADDKRKAVENAARQPAAA